MSVYITVITIVVTNCNSALAEAWLQKEGELQFIGQEFFTQQNYVNSQESATVNSNYYVNQAMFNIYIEYGLTEDITIGTSIAISSYAQRCENTNGGLPGLNCEAKNDVAYRTGGMNFLSAFARYKLLANETVAWSAQVTGYVAGNYENNGHCPSGVSASQCQNYNDAIFGTPPQANLEFRTDIGFTWGGSTGIFQHMGTGQFIEFGIGYVEKFDLLYNQAKLMTTYGWHITENMTILLAIMKIINVPKADATAASSYNWNNWAYNDFDRFSITYIQAASATSSIVLTLLFDVNGLFHAGQPESVSVNNFGSAGFAIGWWGTF